MENFFRFHCVPRNNATDDARDGSPSLHSKQAELVIMQEACGALGASRSVLAASMQHLLTSRHVTSILLIAFEDSSFEGYRLPLESSNKVTFVDFATDLMFLEARMEKKTCTLSSVEKKITDHLLHCNSVPLKSAVIVFDALSPFLENHQLEDLVDFFQRLRRNAAIASVIARHNTSCVSKLSSFALASNASALVWVETIASLEAYPVLAKERRRSIPAGRDGFILTIRNKNTGISSEIMEFFTIEDNRLIVDQMTNLKAKQENHTDTASGMPPVHDNNLTFNVHTSDIERIAKEKVHLPYRHRGSHGGNFENAIPNERPLFYIDDDDLEWDDEDVDDDLDI